MLSNDILPDSISFDGCTIGESYLHDTYSFGSEIGYC